MSWAMIVNENNIASAMEFSGLSEGAIRLRLNEAKRKKVICCIEMPNYIPEGPHEHDWMEFEDNPSYQFCVYAGCGIERPTPDADERDGCE